MAAILIYLIGVIVTFIMSYIYFILWINYTYKTYKDREEAYYEDFWLSDWKPFLAMCTIFTFIGGVIVGFLLIHITLKYLKIIPIFNNFMNRIIKLHNKFITYIFKKGTK